MPRQKGAPKTGGRPPGSGNKVAAEVKAKLTDIVAKYVLTTEGVRNLESDLETLRPVDRVTMIEKLMKFCLPTMGTVAVTDGDGEPLTIAIEWQKVKPKTDEDYNDIDYSESDDLPSEEEDDLP